MSDELIIELNDGNGTILEVDGAEGAIELNLELANPPTVGILEIQGMQGPAGPPGNAVPIAANSFLGNPTGAVGLATAMSPAQSRTLLNLALIATSASASDLSSGILPNARLSPQVVRNDLSYSDPSWITTLAASKITGELLPANIPTIYARKDQANTFTQTQWLNDALRFASATAPWSPGHIQASGFDLNVAGHIGISFRYNTGNVYGGVEIARLTDTSFIGPNYVNTVSAGNNSYMSFTQLGVNAWTIGNRANQNFVLNNGGALAGVDVLSITPAGEARFYGNDLKVYSTGVDLASVRVGSVTYNQYSEMTHTPNGADTLFFNNYAGDITYAGWKFQNVLSSVRTTRAEIRGNGDVFTNGNLIASKGSSQAELYVASPNSQAGFNLSTPAGGSMNLFAWHGSVDNYFDYTGSVNFRSRPSFITTLVLAGNGSASFPYDVTAARFRASNNESYIGFGNHNYLGNITYFRDGVGSGAKANIDGNTGNPTFGNKIVVGFTTSFGSIASPVSSIFDFQSGAGSYLDARIKSKQYSANLAHGDLCLSASPNVGVTDGSNLSDDLVIRGNTGNVEINRGALVAGAATFNGLMTVIPGSGNAFNVRNGLLNTTPIVSVASANQSIGVLAGVSGSGIAFSQEGSFVILSELKTSIDSGSAGSGVIRLGIDGTTGAATFNGSVTSTFQSLSADPTTLDLTAGQCRLIKNTTSGSLRLWANDGGTIKSVTLT